jgi:uncharacterized protein (TIGR03066 family)
MVGFVVCLLALRLGAAETKEKADNATLLVGKWEVTKTAKDLTAGSTIEFAKDGKMKVTIKAQGKEEVVEATYKVEGDKIPYVLKLRGEEVKKEPLIIKKLTEQELVLESVQGDKLELKRVK